ncbi:MAG: tRNA pseudouridine(38-40) synthase TruA [Candidatus Sericytochromatia bacterium]
MKNICLILEYDGSNLNGSQKQNDEKLVTVQGELEKALNIILGYTPHTLFAGRTDAGVSSSDMYVNFYTDIDIRPSKFSYVLNNLMIKEVSVKKSFQANFDFHSRYDATSRTYRYRLLNSDIRRALRNNCVGFYKKKLDFDKMKEAWLSILGKHDFTAFSKESDRVNPECEIFSTTIEIIDDEIVFHITANSFMRGMVRFLVGTTIHIGEGILKPEDLLNLIKLKDRKKVKFLAPPEGLCLTKVEYNNLEIIDG